jgi:hypothetical protein
MAYKDGKVNMSKYKAKNVGSTVKEDAKTKLAKFKAKKGGTR